MWVVKDWHGPPTYTTGFAWCSGQYQPLLCVCVCVLHALVLECACGVGVCAYTGVHVCTHEHCDLRLGRLLIFSVCMCIPLVNRVAAARQSSGMKVEWSSV